MKFKNNTKNFKRNKPHRNEKPKTKSRKDIRKEKRQQKKQSRKIFYEKKTAQEIQSGKLGKMKDKKKVTDKKVIDDEEIDSDFELSDIEYPFKKDNKTVNIKKTAIVASVDRIMVERNKELEEQKELLSGMRQQRIDQLKKANEDEDKIIRKLEKQLKIDKHKNNKSVPGIFNDGLEYALELCLPDNIEKMYSAAKEAAAQDTDDEFQEDIALATGEDKTNKNLKSKNLETKKTKNLLKVKNDAKTESRMNKLRKAEEKYFVDDIDSDLEGSDSEFENKSSDEDNDYSTDEEDSIVEEPILRKKGNKNTKKIKQVMEDSDESDFDIIPSDEGSENEEPIKKKVKFNMDHKNESSEDSDANDGLDDIMKGLGSDDDFEESATDSISEDEREVKKKKLIDKNRKTGNKIKCIGNKLNESDKEDLENNDSKQKIENEWEDIYGRKRDKHGNVLEEKKEKYIPPHIRARLDTEVNNEDPKQKEKLLRLKRQLKGSINRLAETNMYRIASDIEKLYMQNSRFDMNNTLTILINDALINNNLAKERMVLEHTFLIALLHANIGSEIGAHFLQHFVTKFDHLIENTKSYNVENKELDNVLFIIYHMYTFKIFQHNLIYEILNLLTEKLCEKSVECILLALKSVGFILRKDDPVALKDLILTLQKKISESPPDLQNNPRLKFMLEVLLAVKNNNVNKIPQYDPSLAEHLRKTLKTMLTNGKYVTTLNITLNDLLNADERGKWWVVGSAWTGNIKDIGSAAAISKTNNKNQEELYSEQLLELARKQRMNTDDRRNIFCIIMSAEDYVDAFEKIVNLSIKDQRVIVSVIIHCCLSEKIFNPYYAVLAQKFCEFDRKYLLAVQFAIWDKIKDIQSLEIYQVKNLAQLLIYLIGNGGLALSVLKIIEFGELDKMTQRFVRQIILGLLLGKEEICRQVFERIAPSTKLTSFKDSVRLFMHHFLIKGGNKSGIPNDQMDLLKKRVKIADKAIETMDSKLRL